MDDKELFSRENTTSPGGRLRVSPIKGVGLNDWFLIRERFCIQTRCAPAACPHAVLREVAIVLEKGEVGERIGLRELWKAAAGPPAASTAVILDRLMLMPVVALKLGPGDGQWVVMRKEPDVDYKRLDSVVAAIVPPVIAGTRVISKERLRALKLVATSDADRTLIELAALDGLSLSGRSKLTGTNRTATVAQRSNKERALHDAIELFGAYDALAANSALRDVEHAIGVTISEEDVEREVALLEQKAAALFSDCDSESTSSSRGYDLEDDAYETEVGTISAPSKLRVRLRRRALPARGGRKAARRSGSDNSGAEADSEEAEGGSGGSDDGDFDDAFDDSIDDDDDCARPSARARLRRRRPLGQNSPSSKKSSRRRRSHSGSESDWEDDAGYDREDVDVELLEISRDVEASVASGVVPDLADFDVPSSLTKEEADLVNSVILSDGLPTDHDEVPVEIGEETLLDRAEAFISETSLEYTAKVASDACDAASISPDADASTQMAPMLSTLDAKLLVTRLVAYHRRRNRRVAKAKANVKETLGSKRWRGRKRRGVLATYPDIGDAYEQILVEMGCGAAAQRDNGFIVMDKARFMKKGTGFERATIELRKRGYNVSVSTVKRLGLASRSRSKNSKSYYGIVAVKCRRSVKRLGKFNLDAHIRNSKYACMHFIRDRVSSGQVMWVERDDKAKVRMNSGECTSQLPMVGGGERPMHDYMDPSVSSTIYATTLRAAKCADGVEENIAITKLDKLER